MNKTDITIPRGYKPTQVGVIPEDWEVKRFKDLAITNGLIRGPFGGALKKEIFVKSGFKVYQQQNAIYKDIELGDYYINKEKYRELKRFSVDEDDFIVSCSGTIGKIFRIPSNYQKGIINQALLLIRLNEDSINHNYFNYVFESDVIQKRILESQGGAMKNLVGMKQIKKVHFPIPPLLEQEKIADCLSTWDKAITETKKLIAAKQQVKKGLMQQLLTGKKRLAGFTEDWKEVKLGDIGNTFNGLTGKTKSDFGEGEPYVSYLNTYRNNKIDHKTKFDYVRIKPNENQNSLNYGDLIFTTSSETPNEVGISSVILFAPKANLYLNSFCFGLRLKNFTILDPKFAVFLLRSQSFRKIMYTLAQGSTRFNLSKSGFKKIKILVPSIQEQNAIAEILQTADQEIHLLEEKLHALEQQKKGLMQVLLTGKKRLV